VEAPEVETVSPPAGSAAERSEILQPGAVVCSDYEIVRLVAAGDEGEIYETKHQLTGQPAMVKAMPAPEFANTQADERIKNEARTLAKLDHPNLLTLYNFRREGKRYYAVLQIPEGQPLEGIIRSEGPLELSRFRRVLGQVLDGLVYAHHAGLPHGRLTALNVAVDEDDRVKITGFDHFIKSDQEGPRTLAAIRFLAPEQIRNHLADERTDLYAVGVLAYFALSGRVPFDGQSEFDVMRAHLEDAPVDLRPERPEISAALWSLVDQALSKKPDARAPHAQAMLEAFEASTSVEAGAGAPPPIAAQTSQRADAVAGSVSTSRRIEPERTPEGGVAASDAAAKRRYTDTRELYTPELAMPKREPAPSPGPTAVSPQGTTLGHIKPVKVAVSKKDIDHKASPAPIVVKPAQESELPKVVVTTDAQAPSAAPAPMSATPVIIPPLTAPAPMEPPRPTGPRAVDAPVPSAVPHLPDQDEEEDEEEDRDEAVTSKTSAPDIMPAPPPVVPVSVTRASATAAATEPKSAEAPLPKVVVAPEPAAAPAPVAGKTPAPVAAGPKVEVQDEPVVAKEPAPAEPKAATKIDDLAHPASRSDPMQTTPYRGLKIQKGGETEFFSTEQDFDDGHDDFSDLDDFQPKAQRKRRLMIGLIVLLVALSAGTYFGVMRINPYAKAGDTKGTRRTDAHDAKLLAQVYKEDPVLSGEPVKAAMTPAGMTPAGMTPAGMTPAGMTPAGMTPAGMTPDAMTPDAMTPDAMTPDAMTPDAMTPDAMTPAAGGGEAAKLAAEAQKELKRNRNKAEKLAEQALKLDPAEPTARNVLAEVLGAKAKSYLHSGANKGAASTAERATSLNPNLPGPWFYLGVAQNEMGKKAEAKAALSRYIQLCPKCGYNASYAKQILKSIK